MGLEVNALDGIRILDLSRLLPGPACTWILRGLGARVDRIESPAGGDLTRQLPPFVDGAGALFSAVSRGKRSLTLAMRHPRAAEILWRLVGSYDVLIEGFRPGVLEAMGLSPEQLSERHPRLIVARLSGYGQSGPLRDVPGHDLNFCAMGGALTGQAAGGEYQPPLPIQIADMTGALTAAMGICAALFERERTGRGQVLDVSLAEAALYVVSPHIPGFIAESREPMPAGEPLTGGTPLYGTYRCADERYIAVAALEPKFQEALRAVIGTPDDLAAVFRSRPRDEWVALLKDACVGPVLSFHEVATHPQFVTRGAVARRQDATWVRPPLGEVPDDLPVPGLGEHTDLVMQEAGLSPEEIRRFRGEGVFG